MLAFIYRLIRQYEVEHGIRPNLLYLNRLHAENLKASFDQSYSLSQVMDILGVDLIIENEMSHPHVAWTQVAARAAAF